MGKIVARRLVWVLCLVGVAAAVFCAMGCTSSQGTSTSSESSTAQASTVASASGYKVSMVTDTAGLSDRSFNQLCWQGVLLFGAESSSYCSCYQPARDEDFSKNLSAAASFNDLVWGAGFTMSDAIQAAAQENPDTMFALVDGSFDNPSSNLVGVSFRAQESSFVVGYIAAKTTKTNKVGFVGGMQSSTIDQFQWGFHAGVLYGANEDGKTVEVVDDYIGDFYSVSTGESIATKMYSDGCDIVFHAAGAAGQGVINAAVSCDKLVIGVDADQSYLAPGHVLTSALKRIDQAVQLVSLGISDGSITGGNIELGLSDNAVGIPESHELMSPSTYESALKIEDAIIKGNIKPPSTREGYQTYYVTMVQG